MLTAVHYKRQLERQTIEGLNYNPSVITFQWSYKYILE